MSQTKPVRITETILRDAHQSLIATRMSTEQMLPIVEKLDQVGYHSLGMAGEAQPLMLPCVFFMRTPGIA